MADRVFVDAFREVAARHASLLAVVASDDTTITYGALLDRARRCATLLTRRGVRPGDLVALALPKSIDSVVATLATWIVRAAFVPIDPGLPEARRTALHEDARATTTLCSAELRTLDALPPAEFRPCFPDDLAYVIYTSGSAGAPKGVRVAHRGLLPMLKHQIEHFALRPKKRALLYLSTSFDASISDLGTALLAGATLHVVDPGTPEQLLDVLARHAITHADLPPSLLARIDPGALPVSLETIVIGGEVCPVDAVRAFASRVRLVNVYGPTEATICTSLVRCDATWSRPLLGDPIPGIEYVVVDDALAEVLVGVPGELTIRGAGLALGYLRRPDLERAKFVETTGGRAYRTGDRVVRHASGELEFLGRLDRQAKVRGQLVEPEEIEACLTLHPAIQRCAVVPRTVDEVPMLVAFVVTSDIDDASLRAHVLAHLPTWMCPARFERRASLPESPSGKVDLAALAHVPLAPRTPLTPPRGAREEALAEAFRTVLSLDEVGRDDDFFALGGTSLDALQLLAFAESRGIALSADTLYRSPSIAALAAVSIERPRVTVAALDDDARRIAIDRCARARDAHDVLVTGATGHLGARVVHALLSRDDDRVVTCLVRAGDRNEGLARVRSAMARHGLAPPDERRLRIELGDVRRARLGLDAATFDALANRTSSVHHLAADVNLVLPHARLRDTNVLGAANVASLGADVHHASTLSVFACASPKPARAHEHDVLAPEVALLGGYAQTKWCAERVLRDAATTVRFGLLTGDSLTGVASSTCHLMTFVRGVARLGMLPEEGTSAFAVDVTPIDWAARAWIALTERDRFGDDDRIFHVASPRGLRLDELVRAMRAFGVRVRGVSRDEFRARLMDEEMDRTLATTFLGACRRLLDDDERHAASDLFLATGIVFDTTRSDRVLAPLGLAPPTIDRALLFRYFEAALR